MVGPMAVAAAACRAAAVAVAAVVGSIAGVPAAPGSRLQDTATRRARPAASWAGWRPEGVRKEEAAAARG
jgi:hypothetical protein